MKRFCDELYPNSQITNDLYRIRFWSWLAKNESWIESNDGWTVPKIKLNKTKKIPRGIFIPANRELKLSQLTETLGWSESSRDIFFSYKHHLSNLRDYIKKSYVKKRLFPAVL